MKPLPLESTDIDNRIFTVGGMVINNAAVEHAALKERFPRSLKFEANPSSGQVK